MRAGADNPDKRRVARAVSGAVRNAMHAHRGWKIDPRFAASIAKRAAGTLTAPKPDVLAARSASSDQAVGIASSAERPCASLGNNRTGHRRGAAAKRRSPLPGLWRQISIMVGAAKRAGQDERAAALIDVLRMIARRQRT